MEVTRDFHLSLTSSANGAKGCLDHKFRASPAYLRTLPNQLRANNQYRLANQMQQTLRVSNMTQTGPEHEPPMFMTELNIA